MKRGRPRSNVSLPLRKTRISRVCDLCGCALPVGSLYSPSRNGWYIWGGCCTVSDTTTISSGDKLGIFECIPQDIELACGGAQ